MFVLVCGLPGAGKTTVAGEVVDRLGAVRVRTDVVRKDLFPDPEYSDAETDAVYRTVVERADALLEDDEQVVLDGTFRERDFRTPAYALARDHDVDMVLLKVEADDAVVRERIRQREDDASDADVSIYEHYRDKFDPIRSDHVVVDNSGSLDATREQVADAIANPTPVGLPPDA
ncbi:AAA family ATPase [Halorubellus sp. PRR65]|uniref:AAA family ATPase n=1 Tax=Halorubellus sp. PRR65 TaxID=3098148 RepID=UPI002B2595AC|nr:AAA family ATPase [Halorubellus sp. PRR65]